MATLAQGSVLKAGSPLAALSGVTNLKGPAMGITEFIETTAINDIAKKFVANPLTDYGEVTFDLDYDEDDAGHSALRAAAIGKTAYAFQEEIGSPLDLTAAYTGYVSMGQIEVADNGKVKVPVTVKLSGAPTFS